MPAFLKQDMSAILRHDARLGELIAELPRSAIQGPLARAIIIRRLRGLRSWHILGVHRHQQGFSVHLVRVPDTQSGPTPFIRDRWRIRRAVAEAWLHFRRTEAGLYEAATQGFCLHEGATPGRFLLSEMRGLRCRFEFELRRRLARLFGRVGS
jgi:hypothetical protein